VRVKMNVSTIVDVAATPECVHAVLCDVEQWPAWTATMSRVVRMDAGPLRIASRARVWQPKLKSAIWTVRHIAPERGFIWVSHSAGIVMTAGHDIQPYIGGSRVCLSVEASGWLVGLVRRIYGALIESYVSTESRSLKAYCETLVSRRISTGTLNGRDA
jgi:hypothetical protein